jgi:hypothetical protein
MTLLMWLVTISRTPLSGARLFLLLEAEGPMRRIISEKAWLVILTPSAVVGQSPLSRTGEAASGNQALLLSRGRAILTSREFSFACRPTLREDKWQLPAPRISDGGMDAGASNFYEVPSCTSVPSR